MRGQRRGSVRRATASLVALATTLAPAPAAAGLPRQQELDAITSAIRSGEWSRAMERCGKTHSRIWSEAVRRPVPPLFYAELSAICAVAAVGGGDPEAASWHWHVARFFDRKAAFERAKALAPELEMPPLRPPSRTTRDASGRPTKKEKGLRLTDGTVVEGEGPKPIDKGSFVDSQRMIALGHDAELQVEYVLGVDGRLREPVVTFTESCSPTLAFLVLQWHRTATFEPAKVEGKPVEVFFDFGFGLRLRFG